jgi:hypothetical protein
MKNISILKVTATLQVESYTTKDVMYSLFSVIAFISAKQELFVASKVICFFFLGFVQIQQANMLEFCEPWSFSAGNVALVQKSRYS